LYFSVFGNFDEYFIVISFLSFHFENNLDHHFYHHFSKGIFEGCVLGKHPQKKFDKGKTHMASFPLDIIHSDIMGPFPHPSINKVRYVLIFFDDFSHFIWTFSLRKKLEVFQHLKDFKAPVETQSGNIVKVLQTDNGWKYVNHEIQNIFFEVEIQL
jgi:hypothetical protein